jgi:hypothetical protein
MRWILERHHAPGVAGVGDRPRRDVGEGAKMLDEGVSAVLDDLGERDRRNRAAGPVSRVVPASYRDVLAIWNSYVE